MAQSSPTGKNLAQYGFMALPLSFAGLPIYIHAPDFYASQINLSLAAIGFVLLILRFIDAVQDPLIGSISDRYTHHRKLILLLGLIMLGGGFWILFHPITAMPLIWFGLSVFICTTGFSIVSINFQALGALWHADTDDRTRITGWREAFGLVGLLVASIAPSLLGVVNDAPRAFHRLALAYIPLLLIATYFFFTWLKTAPLDQPKHKKAPVTFKNWFDTSWKRHFFGLYLLNSFASSIPAVLVIFFIRDRLDAEVYTGLFLMLYFISGACSMVVWQKASKKIGKFIAWRASMILAILTFIWAAFLGQGDHVFYGIICVLSGMSLGADLAIPPSILADYIADKKDQDIAARYFSIMAFLAKAVLALAAGLTLPMLDWAGYQPGNITDYTVTNSLSYAYAVFPCVMKVGVVIWLWRYLPILEREQT